MTAHARSIARALIAAVLRPVSSGEARRLARQLEEALNVDEPQAVEATDESVARYAAVEWE